MKAEEFDKTFDEDGDVTSYLDLSKACRPRHKQKRINMAFPVWMLNSLDLEAERLGVPRQSLIKMIVSRHIEAKV
jgi:hypothetical protein